MSDNDMEVLAKALNEALEKLEDKPVFTLNGPQRFPALHPGGYEYRYSFTGDEELILTGVRVAGKTTLTLDFDPVDAGMYKSVRIPERKALDAFKPGVTGKPDEAVLLEEHLSTLIGYPGLRWASAKNKFRREHQRMLERQRLEAEQKRLQEQKLLYAENPNWGIF